MLVKYRFSLDLWWHFASPEMKPLQEDNKIKDTLNNYMVMFIVLNTASLQLIPTNVIAIRNSLGSNSPSGIIFPVWILFFQL